MTDIWTEEVEEVRGADVMYSSYSLPTEINLEEFDRTHTDKYGQGEYDVKKIVDIPEDAYFASYYNKYTQRQCLFAILDTDESQIKNLDALEYPGVDIMPLKEYPGLFLHRYRPLDSLGERVDKGSFQASVDYLNSLKIEK